MPDLKQTADRRLAALNRAEEMAWTALAAATGPGSRDHIRQQAELAANLFTCVAAIVGQPTMPTPTTPETEADG